MKRKSWLIKQVGRLLLLLICCFGNLAQVQQADDTHVWDIVQQCVGDLPYPSVPREEWTFEGVIFSRDNKGIRAIRTDVDTSYFVAFDGDTSFALDGSFSPDGRWFAYPKGSTSYANMTSNLIGVGEIEVVSTDPRHTTYSIPWRTFAYSGVARDLKPIVWIDNEYFLAEGELDYGGGFVNPFTGEKRTWDKKAYLYTMYDFSPDFTRAMSWDYQVDRSWTLYDVENDVPITVLSSDENQSRRITWLPDSQGFVATMITGYDAQSSPINSFILFNREGEPTETLFNGGALDEAVSSDGRKIALITYDNRLFIADMESHIVSDLCFTMKGRELAWSPHNINLAFTYDGYPIILNIETLKMQILRYETGEIVGWYSLQ